MISSIEIQQAIMAANEAYMNAISRGDSTGVAELYTESAQFLPSNSESVQGRPAIEAFIQAFIDMGIKAIKLETIEAEGYGDTAFEVGKYIIEGEGNLLLDQGKYIVIWKQEAGQWKLHRNIANTSMPAPE